MFEFGLVYLRVAGPFLTLNSIYYGKVGRSGTLPDVSSGGVRVRAMPSLRFEMASTQK